MTWDGMDCSGRISVYEMQSAANSKKLETFLSNNLASLDENLTFYRIPYLLPYTLPSTLYLRTAAQHFAQPRYKGKSLF